MFQCYSFFLSSLLHLIHPSISLSFFSLFTLPSSHLLFSLSFLLYQPHPLFIPIPPLLHPLWPLVLYPPILCSPSLIHSLSIPSFPFFPPSCLHSSFYYLPSLIPPSSVCAAVVHCADIDSVHWPLQREVKSHFLLALTVLLLCRRPCWMITGVKSGSGSRNPVGNRCCCIMQQQLCSNNYIFM